MIRLYNVDLGIVQAIWRKEVGQNKYQANKISEDWLLLIFPEEQNSTYLQKLLKNMYFLWVYYLDKESSEAFCLCCLSGMLCFLSGGRCECCLHHLEYFLHNTGTQ